jgi:hypothetical protein
MELVDLQMCQFSPVRFRCLLKWTSIVWLKKVNILFFSKLPVIYRPGHSLIQCLFHSVTISSRQVTDTSPTACLQIANDSLKLERKRRQRQKQEEFLQQLKQKHSTNCKDLQTKSLVHKNAGIHHEYFPVQRSNWKVLF